jgi:hypothetical protein
MANRVLTLDYQPPTIDEHRDYMQSLANGHRPKLPTIDVVAEEKRVLERFPEVFAKYVGMETAFLGSLPKYKNKNLDQPDPSNAQGWYSDRSCEAAVRFMASAEIQGLEDDTVDTGLVGLVGKEWTDAFVTFRENVDMPNIKDFLDGKTQWKHNAKRLDRTVALLSGCVTLLGNQKLDNWKQRMANLWGEMAIIAKDSKDVLVEPVLKLAGMPNTPHTMAEAKPVVNVMGSAFKTLSSIK